MDKEIQVKWYKPSEKLPGDGQAVLLREYYRGAKSAQYRIEYIVFYYFEDFGFEIEERRYEHLGLKVTHWLPIPPLQDYKPSEKD